MCDATLKGALRDWFHFRILRLDRSGEPLRHPKSRTTAKSRTTPVKNNSKIKNNTKIKCNTKNR
jgi:hypothetical protein